MSTNGMSPNRTGAVHISQCLHRYVNPFNAISLMKLFQDARGRLFGWGPEFDAMISRSRSMQLTTFYAQPQLGDVLVFLDDDIGFEPEGMHQLIETCEDTREIACGMYVARETQWPHPTLAAYPGTTIHVGLLDAVPVEIKWGATGFMAIHRDVVNAVAKTLSYVKSGPREFIPFFLPFIHEGEFLSEDYAFCQRAKDVGKKTWCDPRIRIAHEGRRAYTISDLNTDSFSQLTTITYDEGGPDVTGLIPDLAHYLGKTALEVSNMLKTIEIRVPAAKEWDAADPKTSEEVKAFYQNAESYLMELVQFNLDQNYNKRTTPATELRGQIVDFGGGLGTLCLRLHKLGLQMTYVDLPSKHREFAEFRFREKAIPIPCYGSLEELESGAYNGLVAADVLEHIHPDDIQGVADEMFRVLKPGAQMVEISDFYHDKYIPEHFASQDLWEAALGQAGFVNDGDNVVKPTAYSGTGVVTGQSERGAMVLPDA